jgi:hypothetical protein
MPAARGNGGGPGGPNGAQRRRRQSLPSFGPLVTPIALSDVGAMSDDAAMAPPAISYNITLTDAAGAADGFSGVNNTTVPLANTFEGLANGTTLTVGNSGGLSGNAFDAISIPTGGTLAADNTHVAHGVSALKVATGSTSGAPAAEWIGSLGGTYTLLYFRIYVFIPAAATPAIRPMVYRTTGGTHIFSPLISGNSLSMSYGSGFSGLSAFTTTIPNNTWCRLEGHVLADATNGTVSMSLFTSQDSTVPVETKTFTSLATGAPIGRVDVGNGNNGALAGPHWLDEPALSATGPIGPAVYPAPLKTYPPASPAFIRSQMPRLYAQNILTGKWLHRDVQGVQNPQITWTLNSADNFSCTINPPRADLLDASGEPIFNEWQTALYLEENDEIKFGGILTSSQFAGPEWQLGAIGFSAYPNGMPYEGAVYKVTFTDGLDVVRYLWKWLQDQVDANLGLVLDSTKSGVQVGAYGAVGAQTTLDGGVSPGAKNFKVHEAKAFKAKMIIDIGVKGTDQYTIKSVYVNSDGGGWITPTVAIRNGHDDGAPVDEQNSVPVTPFELDWWNSTDIGQEIQSIQQECVFDYFERHTWADATKQAVKHRLGFGVPRVGVRQTGLRFVEGENIALPSTVTRDGTKFANNIVGIGNGQGSASVRSTVAVPNGRLRRTFVYTDQTITAQARLTAKIQKTLASMQNIDTPTTVTVINHPHAPFGSFSPGDDIPIRLASGWRTKDLIWCRITAMTQDPTTNLMTLTLARSDSFSYLAESGQAGTI